MNIHYSIQTGDIVSHGGAVHIDGEASHFPGCKILMRPDQDVTGKKVDLATLTLVDAPPPPAPDDPAARVVQAVRRELADTDKYMIPDFPVSETGRGYWRAYRQALRDSSKGRATSPAMLAAIPARPDGHDAFAHIRKLPTP